LIRLFALALFLAVASPAALAQATDGFADALKAGKADPAIAAAINAKDRSMESRVRDKDRYTEAILHEAAIKPGMRVLDVGSGGGTLALLFSTLVGDKGHVDIHNTPGWINQFPGMDADVQKRRIKRDNIGWITAAWDAIPVQPDSYDVIMLGQVYHDTFLEAADIQKMNASLFAMLKPGGRLVIEDHDANPEMPLGQQANLHRISHGDVTGQLTRAGFVLKELLLHDSPNDDVRFNVFTPTVRSRTDRFIAVFQKPAG
jgi:predicted methyltransferase